MHPAPPRAAERPPPEALARPRPASSPALSALLIVGGPALLALLASESLVLSRELAVACGVLVSGAGFTLARGLVVSRLLALAGLAVGLWAASPMLMSAPDFVLLFAVLALAISSALWQAQADGGEPSLRVTLTSPAAVHAGALVAASTWLALAIRESSYGGIVMVSAIVCFSLPSAFLVGWAIRWLRAGDRAALVPLAWLLAALALAAQVRASALWALAAWAAGLLLAAPFVQSGDDAGSAWGVLLEHPARLIAATFGGLCALGTLALALPSSSTTGHSLGLLDAAFTAVSAGCVTGLVVVDTPSAFTPLGQGMLLLLIQVGGLGIMTFYTVALRALGRRLGLKHELVLAEVAQVDGQASLYQALGVVLRLTFSIELVGAAALCGCFASQGLGWREAAWRGLFTAISAFCNAGFALETSSLMPHQSDPLILAIVGLLIVLGGLAPPAVLALWPRLRGEMVPLQTRLVWWTTSLILGVGFIVFLAFEWSHSLAGLAWWDKLSNAAFQSATLRTAGFNSVDLSTTQAATQVFMMALMFIGASPGGTGGGIKTTTAALLLLAVLASLGGRRDVTVFQRRIVHTSIYRAAAIATVGLSSAVAVVLALLLTQRMPPEMAMFEAVSAVATVGLSTGGTALLDGVGKVIIMIAMFFGRVGPLTLFLLLSEHRERSRWQFPDAQVDVG